MKTLDTQFVSGEGGYSADPLHYTMVVRNGNFAVYQRSYSDGRVKDYETITIKVLKAGTQIFKKTVTEDEERYPSTTQFGRIAWSFRDKQAALNKMENLVNGVKSNMVETTEDDETETVSVKVETVGQKRRGRVAAVRPTVVYPKTDFTMKELLMVNKDGWTQPSMYLKLQQDITSSIVKEVGRRTNDSGRGKPSVVYTLASKE